MLCVTFFALVLCFGFFDSLVYLLLGGFLLVFLFLGMSSWWFGGLFFCDSLSFFLLYLTFLVFYFCMYSSFLDFWSGNSFTVFKMLLSAMFFLLIASFTFFSVFLFYVCFEIIFMIMYLFVMGWGSSPERIQASFYMVFYTIVVSFPFLVYLLSFEESVFSLKFLSFFSFSSYWWGFICLVFLVKLPVYGVHLWLPKAHVEAPVSGSMVLAGVLLKLGGYGFFRFSSYYMLSLHLYSGYLVSVGLTGGLWACFICLRQVDLKALVAYSSVCHMGFGLGGIYSGSLLGAEGGLYMLIAHGFCSSCLFFILYVFYERSHSRSSLVVKGLGGLAPMLLLFWFVLSAFNMGVPPTFSFFSEIFILGGLGLMSMWSMLFSGIFLFLSGVYGIFLYVISCHGCPVISNSMYCLSPREYLNFFGHLFPLLYLPLVVGVFSL